jgi:hypothetical protein
MRWWMVVAATGGLAIAIGLARLMEREARQSEREQEAWMIRRQRRFELEGRRLHVAWRAQ